MLTDFSNPFTVITEKFYIQKNLLSMHLHYHKYVADLPRKANSATDTNIITLISQVVNYDFYKEKQQFNQQKSVMH